MPKAPVAAPAARATILRTDDHHNPYWWIILVVLALLAVAGWLTDSWLFH